MQLHELRPTHKRKQTKTIGRGGKRGCYSGKGIKGQSSRSGRRMKPVIRELIKRYPKLRGYRNKPLNPGGILILDLGLIDKKFKAGDKVNFASLTEKGLMGKLIKKVKILGTGSISKKMSFEGLLFSATARKKIEKSGGEIK